VVLVLVVAVLALAAAALTGGLALGQLKLRAIRLLVAAAGLQLSTSILLPGSGTARAVALILTALLVGLFVYGNWAVAGTPLIGLGLLLNIVVITANAAMPVSVHAAARAGLTRVELGLDTDAMREPATSSTRLPWLGDVVPVALPWRPQVVSPGDVLVAAGVGLLLVAASGRQTPSRASRSTDLARESTTIGSYS
jgi:hypothetical protein